MQLSVVVPTLNGRDQLASALDALAEHAPDAEVVVVNGPSADGTTGMIRERDDVDVLIELSARTLNVARNAGIDAASGDVVALLRYDLSVESTWREALERGLQNAAVVTGPTHRTLQAGMTTEDPERQTISGRDVTYFNGGNVAFRVDVADALDGFDEYLQTGGARDAAHRLAGLDYDVAWEPGMCVRREFEADGGVQERDLGWKYRALAYRLVKNYGLRPTVARRTVAHAVSDAVDGAREIVAGTAPPTSWFASGKHVVTGIARGTGDGLIARARDRTDRRNPHGSSNGNEDTVAVYDWR
jgi:glycosyltransferase involved in cell wall biosynthesis